MLLLHMLLLLNMHLQAAGCRVPACCCVLLHMHGAVANTAAVRCCVPGGL